MKYWIDVEDRAGHKYGDGPIVTCMKWTTVSCLDKAGSFEFTMPGSDPRSALLLPRRIVRCFWSTRGKTIEVGAGVIDTINPTVNKGGTVTLKVSGSDLLREMTFRNMAFTVFDDGSGNGITNPIASCVAEVPGWTVSATEGTQEPELPYYTKWEGESVLTALNRIAVRTGEHFRLKTGRSIVWIGRNAVSTGIRAVPGIEFFDDVEDDKICFITNLNIVEDSYDIVSRVYPYGGLHDNLPAMIDRSDLDITNLIPGVTFTFSKPENWIQINATEAAYGYCEQYLFYDDIVAQADIPRHRIVASNQLVLATCVYLASNIAPKKNYEVNIERLNQVVSPGDSIRIVFRKIIDSYKVVDIDQEMVILEASSTLDNKGIRTTKVTVGTIDKWYNSNWAIIAGMLDKSKWR